MRLKCKDVIYDLTKLTEEARTKQFAIWHQLNKKEKLEIFCCCNEMANIYPPMHVRYLSQTDKYIIANHSLKQEDDRELHDSSCPYNNTFRKTLNQIGINYDEEKDMFSVNLSTKRKKAANTSESSSTSSYRTGTRATRNMASTDPMNRLYYLFLTMLEYRRVEKYTPEGSRNLKGRIWSAAEHVQVNRKLLKDMLYIAGTDEKKINKKIQLIVGWGNKVTHEPDPDIKFPHLMRIPLLALDKRDQLSIEVTISKSVYNKGICFDHLDVKTGYWLIWKEAESPDDWPKEKEIVFVPADEKTGIPVESGLELKMLAHLVQKQKSFKKPLIQNVIELDLDLRPDMVVYGENEKIAIIEVAGFEDDAYREKLEWKRKKYLEKGYQYLQWEGKSSLEEWDELNNL
ncbi:hypothetical protein POF51_26160 [Brevibacillus sp. AG]|uniref:hypothetical protein n=1 Tax=Brevibacillus sp. AG TaxID=3020891 RepID=UPI00232D7C2F|nr:hypothetical protein [Brevibacillus sp. AG]MDC0764208.1 hypothetical protein [Brevibacillus sp. AG]